MAAAGFHIVSHGNLPGTVASGSGVLLAVRSGYAGSWQDVARDSCGRAVAANVVSSNGTSLRFAAIYGPTGACLPGFSCQQHLIEEANLKTFLDSQINFATSNHLQLIVGGDLNSFCSDHLDRWGGSYVLRPECTAAHLAHRGLLHTFRLRHPSLHAFTFFSHHDSASRLDAVWLLPSPGLEIQTLNAAIL